MIACLSVFVYPYDTASGVNQIPYLHHSKGVQAQPFGIGYKMDGSTFFVLFNLSEPRTKKVPMQYAERIE